MLETIQEHLEAIIFGTIKSEIPLREKVAIIEAILDRYNFPIDNLQELIENIDINKPITIFDTYIDEIVAKTLEDNLKAKGKS